LQRGELEYSAMIVPQEKLQHSIAEAADPVVQHEVRTMRPGKRVRR